MRQPPLQTRTRRAHETAAFARAHGTFEPVDRALHRAFFEQGRDINDLAVLQEIVFAAGLNPDDLARALASGAHSDDVRADVQLAADLELRGVPAMLVGETLEDAEPVIGAVPYEWLEGAIQRALDGDRTQARMRRRFRPDLPVIE